MVTAVVESPLRQRQRLLRSPLARTGTGNGNGNGVGDFEFRHWRAVKRVSGGMRGRWAPPEIEIPNGLAAGVGAGRGGSYTSLRDIMSSPEYAKHQQQQSSPVVDSCGGGDVHMIRHPLVKHAAYAYLQLTPSAREERARRRQGGAPLRRLVFGCLGFLGALFGR